MIAYTLEEQLKLQGFRNGYALGSESREIQNKMLNLHHDPAYMEGLKKGLEEYHKDRVKTLVEKRNLEQRQDLLRHLRDKKQKDRGKEGKER